MVALSAVAALGYDQRRCPELLIDELLKALGHAAMSQRTVINLAHSAVVPLEEISNTTLMRALPGTSPSGSS